jgi:hypothetical protein
MIAHSDHARPPKPAQIRRAAQAATFRGVTPLKSHEPLSFRRSSASIGEVLSTILA